MNLDVSYNKFILHSKRADLLVNFVLLILCILLKYFVISILEDIFSFTSRMKFQYYITEIIFIFTKKTKKNLMLLCLFVWCLVK